MNSLRTKVKEKMIKAKLAESIRKVMYRRFTVPKGTANSIKKKLELSQLSQIDKNLEK